MTPETEAFIRDEWIPALRSGNYRQGVGALKMYTDPLKRTAPRYGCLGVICDLKKVTEETGWASTTFVYGDSNASAFLPSNLANELGIPSDGQFVPGLPEGNTLAQLNDDARWSFIDIADFLEHEILNPESEYRFDNSYLL